MCFWPNLNIWFCIIARLFFLQIYLGTKNWVSTLHVEKQTKSSNTASHWSISASSLNRVKRGRWLAEIRWRQSRPLLSWVCSANEPSKVLCGASCSKFLAGIVSTCCWCWCIILAGLEDRPSPHSSRIKNPYTYEKVIHLYTENWSSVS